MKRILSAAGGALLAACASAPQAPPPPLVDPGPSNITLTVKLPLADAVAALEREIPKRIDQTRGYEISPDGRFGLQYVVERDPVALSGSGNTIRSSVVFRYAVRACYRTTLRGREAFWPCASCGFDESKREAKVTLNSRLQWDAGMFVRSTTTAEAITFLDRCRMSGLQIDVTDWQIRPFIESQTAAAAAQLDAAVRQNTGLTTELAAIWKSLQEPAPIGPDSWFVLRPQSLRFGPLAANASAVQTTVTLVASPRVVLGARPQIAPAAMPAPTFGSADDPRLRVSLAVELSFADAEKLLARDPKRRFTIARANGGGVVLTSSEYRITGTPRVNAVDKTISLPDLDYEARGGRSFFDWFRHGAMRANLRRRATLNLAPHLERFRRGIEETLRGRGVAAAISSIEPIAIATLDDRFVITAVATGTADMKVTRQVQRPNGRS